MKIGRTKFAQLSLMIAGSTLAIAQGRVVKAPEKPAQTNVIRVIRDPHTAMRWLLEREPSRPGGPGRMVLVGPEENSEPASEMSSASGTTSNPPSPVIRGGDRVVVEEKSLLVEARLEGIALGSAVEGAEFRVRLTIGGKVLRAVALGPGRAAFAAIAERP
jgi:hypothetical protein